MINVESEGGSGNEVIGGTRQKLGQSNKWYTWPSLALPVWVYGGLRGPEGTAHGASSARSGMALCCQLKAFWLTTKKSTFDHKSDAPIRILDNCRAVPYDG